MKLLVDMNLSPRWVSLLADAGFEVAHWSTLGASNAADTVVIMLIGYARVSTQDQNLDLQCEALNKAGCKKVME
jgi:predicted nuclease of predicted toxin-antitoxin system